MKVKKMLVGIVASVLVVASVATTAFAANSPSTDKVVTPTPAPSTSGGSGSSSSSKSSGTIDVDALASGISGDVIKYDGVDLDPTIPADLYKLTKDIIQSAINAGAKNIIKAVDAEDSSNHDGKGVNYQEGATGREL